jgi:predicted RNA-binding Zn-ribbon protein involved in translation (DUF1610 family)
VDRYYYLYCGHFGYGLALLEGDKETKNMKSVCAWCGKVIREGDGEVSHGMCPKCQEKMRVEFEEWLKKNEIKEVKDGVIKS